jgi:hypothetical protein
LYDTAWGLTSITVSSLAAPGRRARRSRSHDGLEIAAGAILVGGAMIGRKLGSPLLLRRSGRGPSRAARRRSFGGRSTGAPAVRQGQSSNVVNGDVHGLDLRVCGTLCTAQTV